MHDDSLYVGHQNERNIYFDKENSQGNQWNEGYFEIEPTNADFQIVFEATGSRGLISDIAIDDVSLMKDGDCMKYLNRETTFTESDGVFDMQSCANRCLETKSVRGNNGETIFQEGHLIEKCDCHQQCLDTSTCCWDYISTCIESISQPADSDTMMSTLDENLIEFTTTELDETPTSVRTTIKTTTQKPTEAITKSTSTLSTTKNTTLTTPTTLSSTTAVSTSTVSKTSKTRDKSTVTNQVINSTLSTLLPWNTTKNIVLNTIMTPSKTYTTTAMPVRVTTNMTTLTTESTKKVSSSTQLTKTTITLLKTVSKTTSVPSITTATSIPVRKQYVTQKGAQIFARMTSTTNFDRKFVTTTDATLNAMHMHSKHSDQQLTRGQFAWITTILVVCVLSMLMLTGWKYFSAQKWNQFNSQQIEYKSKYHSDEIEESLVRSNSFIVDDSFSETLIDTNESKSISNSKEKNNSSTNIPNKTKKVSNRLAKTCDQYSETRCLTIDDEQFDFSPQMHE